MGKFNIVLYGDSNTYGLSPDGSRYDNRYGIVLKNLLNNSNVFEEGVIGRTTIYHDDRPGKKAIDTINNDLSKYDDIDLLIVMLGTNDYKIKNSKNLDDLERGMDLLINKIKELNNIKNILLISPILLSKNIEKLDKDFNHNSYIISTVASNIYQELAKKNNILFYDAKYVAFAGSDGEHFTKESHIALGNALANFISNTFEI